MVKNKEFEAQYKEEGRKRIAARKANRLMKITKKTTERDNRKRDCCEGNPNCNGTTDCMWY